jgi:hypothetical protein
MKTIQFDVTFNTTIFELGLGTSVRGQVMVTQVINPLSKVHVEDMMISIGNENIQHQSISLVVSILRRTLRPVVIRFQRVVPVRRTRAKNGIDDVRVPNHSVVTVLDWKTTATSLAAAGVVPKSKMSQVPSPKPQPKAM